MEMLVIGDKTFNDMGQNGVGDGIAIHARIRTADIGRDGDTNLVRRSFRLRVRAGGKRRQGDGNGRVPQSQDHCTVSGFGWSPVRSYCQNSAPR